MRIFPITSVSIKNQLDNVSRLIDNKRKHLQKKLSAAQKEQILINEVKEDVQFKKDLATAIEEWSRSFPESMKVIGQSLTDIGAATSRSIEVMSQSLQSAVNSNIYNKNLFYQQDRQQFIPGPFTQILNQPFPEPRLSSS